MPISQTETAPGATLAAIRALRPLFDKHRHEAHQQARMTQPVLDACRKAGLFTMVSPREVGGADADFPETMAVFEELGYSDPTIAWHAGNSFALARNAVFLGPEERATVFAGEPGPFGFSAISGGVGRAVDGGYRLSGRWQFVTGALDAPWAWLNGVAHDENGPRMIGETPDARAFIVPAADFAIERTWDRASAMRGTGSHAVTVEDAFVPDGLALSVLNFGPRQLESKAARWPFGAASPVTNAAIAVGIARRAVDEAIELIKTQSPRAAYSAYRTRPDALQAVANGAAAVAAYRAGLMAMAEEVESASAGDSPVPEGTRARMWASMFWTLDRAREVVSDMARISTSNLYSGDNASELGLRDLHAICASMETVRDGQEAAGRVFLGMPPARIPF